MDEKTEILVREFIFLFDLKISSFFKDKRVYFGRKSVK